MINLDKVMYNCAINIQKFNQIVRANRVTVFSTDKTDASRSSVTNQRWYEQVVSS